MHSPTHPLRWSAPSVAAAIESLIGWLTRLTDGQTRTFVPICLQVIKETPDQKTRRLKAAKYSDV